MTGSRRAAMRAIVTALIGGVVLGLLLGLAVSWWWWPVQWTNATPSGLRSDFQNDYILWVAEQYAATGDLEWARGKLGVEYWKAGWPRRWSSWRKNVAG